MQLRRYKTPAASTEETRGARVLGRGWRRATILTATALTVVAAPVAIAAGAHANRDAHAASLGDKAPLRGAIHNPAAGAFFRTTGIFANFNSWTMRVQNVGSGGAAVFGCKAGSNGSACLTAENNNGGLAFSFAGNGASGGKILLTNSTASPFTTNAHGEATGLNANYLQGKTAADFLPATGTAANSTQLGGKPATEYATNGQLLFADVAGGKIVNNRGASAVTPSGEDFIVAFNATDVSKCAYTVSPTGAALASGQLAVEPTAGHTNEVTVNVPATFKAGFDLQVIC
jgi:hypothetical protein